MKNTEGKKKAGKTGKSSQKEQERLHTEGPISEKDEIKMAEDLLRKRAEHK